MQVIETAVKEKRKNLSEYESKQVLKAYGIPVTREITVDKSSDLAPALKEIGFPLVMKGCSSEVAHKTEKNLIRLDIRTESEAGQAFDEIMAGMNGAGGAVLIQEMVKGPRELMAGLTRDPQFGPCVMFGLGGIFTEILKDVAFRVAPLQKVDALDMMQEIRGHKILEAVRGMEAADLDQLSDILINLGKIGLEQDQVKEIDINPLILSGRRCVAVDALVILN